MIKGFETLTYEITPEEEQIMSAIISGLKKREGSARAVKAPEIVDGINRNLKMKKKFTEVRLRKMINYIRTHGLLPVMASSKGYYVSFDKNEINAEMESLFQRASGIKNAAMGLRKFL